MTALTHDEVATVLPSAAVATLRRAAATHDVVTIDAAIQRVKNTYPKLFKEEQCYEDQAD